MRVFLAGVLAVSVALAACGERGGVASFCDRVGREGPALVTNVTSAADVDGLVARYESLLDRAPAAVSDELRQLTDLVRAAAAANPDDATQQARLAEMAYAASAAAGTLDSWVQATCGFAWGEAPPTSAPAAPPPSEP